MGRRTLDSGGEPGKNGGMKGSLLEKILVWYFSLPSTPFGCLAFFAIPLVGGPFLFLMAFGDGKVESAVFFFGFCVVTFFVLGFTKK